MRHNNKGMGNHMVSPVRRFGVALQTMFRHLGELDMLFRVGGVLATLGLWVGVTQLIHSERAGAERAAQTLTRELAETYEAQVVRALQEIDKHIQVIQYAYEQHPEQPVLPVLQTHDLLPPPLLFNIALLDPRGKVIESSGAAAIESDRAAVASDGLHIATVGAAQSPKIQFSQSLRNRNGDSVGTILIEADAAFFVSSYDAAKLGAHGTLGLVGDDGRFRVKRTGSAISAGEALADAHLVTASDVSETAVFSAALAPDPTARYVAARQLYDFPLAVLVGLSHPEQLAATNARATVYRWRTAAVNALLLAVLAMMWRLSHKLAESRRLEMETRIAHAQQVEHLAYHDGLTGLPNRSFFSKLLAQGIAQAMRGQRPLAVLFLDLDHFKQINDTLGHDAGDQLLQEVALRLKNCLRASDTVARLGGDEFVVILPELSDNAYVVTVARKIIAAVAQPFLLKGQEFSVTTSVGISTCPQDGTDEQMLTKNADLAMYKAKQEGKNNFQMYSPKLHSESLERLALESSLRHALDNGELAIYYQAKRDIQSGAVTGLEALLRWRHPDLGIIEPKQFLPVAEDIGLLVPIGKWLLRAVCEQNVRWQREGAPKLSVAVNLTARQLFNETLAADVGAILQQTGMDASLLELEISESVLMQHVDRAAVVLNVLKEIGVRIAIDNFGVGYSSLSMLKRFPLDTIKIDRTFIGEISDEESSNSLTRAIVAMGRTLGLTVVAQGVETEEQIAFLRRNACDEVQGFYFSEPVPAEQLGDALTAGRTLDRATYKYPRA